ncbi:MAG TPA: universal stress protein, partial [Rhabdaerophilum sp.]|nr:universal stress protein [Rhabdaerophilum sp.]
AAGVEADVQVVAGVFAELGSRAARVARSADLVVVDQQHGALDTSEMLLEEALFRSGRPVLIASPRRTPVEEVRSIVVGWDGSSHAARAVSDALATFPTLKKIEIVTISGEKSLKNILPGADFAQHLARKGVEVMLTDVAVDGRSVAEILDGCAIAAKADLIVAGAFGHSRLREFLLGGVTVDLTEKATTPVLMAY